MTLAELLAHGVSEPTRILIAAGLIWELLAWAYLSTKAPAIDEFAPRGTDRDPPPGAAAARRQARTALALAGVFAAAFFTL